MIWLPVHKEDRLLNLIALGVVFLLLALGFEVLKLPAELAPAHSPLLQIIGVILFLVLNGAVIWMAARDDFIRPSYGLPRAAGALVALTLAATTAFLIRGLLSGAYVLSIGEPINLEHAIAVAIGGQVVIMPFMAVFFLKKPDAAKVREFKRQSNGVRTFMRDWLQGKIRDPAKFYEKFQAVSETMQQMPTKAAAAAELVWECEAEHAGRIGAFFAEAYQYIVDRPDSSIMKGGAAFVQGREDTVKAVLGADVLKRIQPKAIG